MDSFVEIRTFGIGPRNIVRRIVKTVINNSCQLSTLIFRDLCDSILAGKPLLCNQLLVLFDHLGDCQLDFIIVLACIAAAHSNARVRFLVIITIHSRTAVLAKKGFDKLLVFGCIVRIAEMRVNCQSGICGLTKKISVNFILRDEHFALAQEVWLCGEVALRQVQTVQHNADTVCVITA